MAQEIPEQIFIGAVTQKALIQKEGKILVSRDVGMTNWDIPGGRLHGSEEPKYGLIREVKEELGVDIEVGKPFHTDIFTPTNPRKMNQPHFLVVYHAVLSNPSQPFVLAPDEIEEVRWIDRNEFGSLSMWDEYKQIGRASCRERV